MWSAEAGSTVKREEMMVPEDEPATTSRAGTLPPRASIPVTGDTDVPEAFSEPDALDRGMAQRRAVLGDAHVDHTQQRETCFDADFQRYITLAVWGQIWTRPGLPLPERHLITISLLAALGREEELALHLRSIGRTGVTQEQVREAFLHVAVYAGVPAANSAFRVAKAIWAEFEKEKEEAQR
jgi:4-carboxymuconolactone decarboxylase